MKNLLLGLVLLLGVSCVGPSTSYRSANVAPSVNLVVARHNSYVEADDKLDSTQKSNYFGEAGSLTSLVQNELIPADLFRATVTPVLDRYDGYVVADASLSVPQRVTRLRTSELIRKLLATKP